MTDRGKPLLVLHACVPLTYLVMVLSVEKELSLMLQLSSLQLEHYGAQCAGVWPMSVLRRGIGIGRSHY